MRESHSRAASSTAVASKSRPPSSGQAQGRQPEHKRSTPPPSLPAPDHPEPRPLVGIGRARAEERRIFLFTLKGQLLYADAERAEPGSSAGRPESSGDRDLRPHLQQLCSRLRALALPRSGPGRPQAHPAGEAVVVKVGPAGVRLRGLLLDPAGGAGEPAVLIVADGPGTDRQPLCDAAYLKQAYNLTQREMEVLEWVRRGASYKEMANALGISPHTIRDHILKMKLKFQADSKCGIMARLIEETCHA